METNTDTTMGNPTNTNTGTNMENLADTTMENPTDTNTDMTMENPRKNTTMENPTDTDMTMENPRKNTNTESTCTRYIIKIFLSLAIVCRCKRNVQNGQDGGRA